MAKLNKLMGGNAINPSSAPAGGVRCPHEARVPGKWAEGEPLNFLLIDAMGLTWPVSSAPPLRPASSSLTSNGMTWPPAHAINQERLRAAYGVRPDRRGPLQRLRGPKLHVCPHLCLHRAL